MAENEVQRLKAKKVVNGEAENAVITVSAIMPKLLVEAPKANEAIQFYKNAFGAVEVSRSLHSKRKADHDLPLVHEAQLKIGGATILVSDNFDDSEALEKTGSLDSIGCLMCLETEEVIAATLKAKNAGATLLEGVEGDSPDEHGSKVKDPYGYLWIIRSPLNSTPVEA